MDAMFTVVRGPGIDEIEDGKRASFQVQNCDTQSSESSVVSGIISDLSQRSDGRVDFHLTDDTDARITWINNYDPALQEGGYGERI